ASRAEQVAQDAADTQRIAAAEELGLVPVRDLVVRSGRHQSIMRVSGGSPQGTPRAFILDCMADRGPDWQGLRSAIGGEVLVPGSRGYDEARMPAIAQFGGYRPRAVV